MVTEFCIPRQKKNIQACGDSILGMSRFEPVMKQADRSGMQVPGFQKHAVRFLKNSRFDAAVHFEKCQSSTSGSFSKMPTGTPGKFTIQRYVEFTTGEGTRCFQYVVTNSRHLHHKQGV